MQGDIEFEIQFTDHTMKETDGNYKLTNKLMTSEFPYVEKWMINTEVIITTPFGVCQMELNFYHDKNIYIINYIPSISDVFYNPDLRCLTLWAQSAGWNIPRPKNFLIKSNLEFWKHFWETLIIDSDYLDDIFGKREHEL